MSESISNEAVEAEWTPRKVWELLGADYQPPLEAIRKVAQAHNAALTKACAERDEKLTILGQALKELVDAYVEENGGDMPSNDSHPAHMVKEILSTLPAAAKTETEAEQTLEENRAV